MRQTRITRKARTHGGRPDIAPDALPVLPVRDTRAATAVLARIDAALAAR